MIAPEAFASIDMAWIFAFIFLRSRSTRERLPSASDRLPPLFCWMKITMPKKLASATRHALVKLDAGVAEGHADSLALDDGAEFTFHRLLRVGDDNIQAVHQRQAGFDAAHDDIDGVREMR